MEKNREVSILASQCEAQEISAGGFVCTRCHYMWETETDKPSCLTKKEIDHLKQSIKVTLSAAKKRTTLVERAAKLLK